MEIKLQILKNISTNSEIKTEDNMSDYLNYKYYAYNSCCITRGVVLLGD